jgi:GDP-4-dehydro-6-deoxy-D-mannose reductase
MKKIMITGFSGFVGRHFVDYLNRRNIEAEIIGIDVNKPRFPYSRNGNGKSEYRHLNLLNNGIGKVLKEFRPDYVLHLASFSSVAYSWIHPIDSFQNNTNIFLNLLQAVHELELPCRILSIGSCEEYGVVTEEDLPIKEDHRLNPISPYAVARVSQEMLSKVYSDSYGLDVVMTRSFNHIGPHQDPTFAISSFAGQLLKFKHDGLLEGNVHAGNVDNRRDFTDVRDVVDAYYRLLESGKKGEVYNVCSGQGVSLRSVIETMASLLNIRINIVQDPQLIRKSDIRDVIGCNEKIRKEIGWQVKYPLKNSLQDILDAGAGGT